MKIAFVVQPFDGIIPPYQNSIGLIIYNSARILAEKASVTVYYPRRRKEHILQDLDGVLYRPVPIDLDRRLLKVAERLPGIFNQSELFASWIYYPSYISRIAWDARRRDFDIVHIVNFSQFAPPVKRLNPRTRVVLEMQCEWLTQLSRPTIKKRLGSVDMVTGSSDHISHGVREAFPELSIPCRTAYNGVDPARFQREVDSKENHPEKSRTVLFVGRVSPEKGVHVLIDAMAEVVKQVPDARLLIVGPRGQLPLEYIVGLSDDEELKKLAVFYDGTLSQNYQDHLEKRVDELNIRQNVEFTGGMTQQELVGLYHQARLLVNPSYSESFGMSLVEGMAVGLPVVATRVGGMKEIVDPGNTGFLVEMGNARELCETLLKLLTDDQLCKTMGANGYQRALELFSWERRARDLWEYYTSLVTNG